MKYTAEEICEKLGIDIKKVWNIYPYGSQVYGTASEDSDHDFIIVYKQSILPSGAFKDNAISSRDYLVQGTCYSRAGFINAINTYQMPALEAIFLSDDLIIKKTFDFKMNKYDEKEMCKKVVTLASASWHNAILSYRDDNFEFVDKNIYHALRILDFGNQIKEHRQIVDYGSCNELRSRIYIGEELNDPKYWYSRFIEMSNRLKRKMNFYE